MKTKSHFVIQMIMIIPIENVNLYLVPLTGVTLDIQRKKHILFYNLLLLKFSKIILIYSFEAIYQHYKWL